MAGSERMRQGTPALEKVNQIAAVSFCRRRRQGQFREGFGFEKTQYVLHDRPVMRQELDAPRGSQAPRRRGMDAG